MKLGTQAGHAGQAPCLVALALALLCCWPQGFLHLELNKVEAAGTWVDVDTIRTRNYTLMYSDTYFTALGTNRVQARPIPFVPESMAMTLRSDGCRHHFDGWTVSFT
ncbi:hypothetical protein V8C86DRAFT_1723502 [Haematococcus lacustris]